MAPNKHKILMQIWYQFRIKLKKIAAEIALSSGAFWDKVSEQRKHQSIKKAQVLELD